MIKHFFSSRNSSQSNYFFKYLLFPCRIKEIYRTKRKKRQIRPAERDFWHSERTWLAVREIIKCTVIQHQKQERGTCLNKSTGKTSDPSPHFHSNPSQRDDPEIGQPVSSHHLCSITPRLWCFASCRWRLQEIIE